jgi:hypothetical protein
MTPKLSPTTGVNVEEELAQLREAIENLELFDERTNPLEMITYLGDIVDAASRARTGIEARLAR